MILLITFMQVDLKMTSAKRGVDRMEFEGEKIHHRGKFNQEEIGVKG